jgi:hypothetical protein
VTGVRDYRPSVFSGVGGNSDLCQWAENSVRYPIRPTGVRKVLILQLGRKSIKKINNDQQTIFIFLSKTKILVKKFENCWTDECAADGVP